MVRRDGRAGRVLRHPFRVLSSGTLAPCERVSPGSGARVGAPGGVGSYLVDSASSHMLVSKIKPCMSKYKQSIL